MTIYTALDGTLLGYCFLAQAYIWTGLFLAALVKAVKR